MTNSAVAVILGEYGAYPKSSYPQMRTYTNYWTQYITRSIFQHGLVPMLWDTGSLFDRASGAQRDSELIGVIVNSAQ